MSTDYFIFRKPKLKPLTNNEENEIVYMNHKICYILPRNLMTYYCDNGLFESALIDWCKQFCSQDKIMLDIGAHTGTYALSLASFNEKIYCFEPQKMTYYALCGSVALSNIHNIVCLNIGLGSVEQCGKKYLHIVSNDGGGSSLHTPTNANILREEEIIVDTLDHLELSNIGFIKIDVEENEYFVLLGAKQSLVRSHYPTILFESNPQDRYRDSIFQLLQEMNYQIITLQGVNNMFLASHAL